MCASNSIIDYYVIAAAAMFLFVIDVLMTDCVQLVFYLMFSGEPETCRYMQLMFQSGNVPRLKCCGHTNTFACLVPEMSQLYSKS